MATTDSTVSTGDQPNGSKPLALLDRPDLVAYVMGIQPSEDADALKYLEFQPLLERALVYQSQLDGLRTDDPSIKQLPPLADGKALTIKHAREINDEFKLSLSRQRQRANSGKGNDDNNNNNNNNRNDVEMRGKSKKRNFKEFKNESVMDILVNISKDIDIKDQKAVENFERISKALQGGNIKKKRRKGDSLVFSFSIFYLFLLPCINIFASFWLILHVCLIYPLLRTAHFLSILPIRLLVSCESSIHSLHKLHKIQ